MKTGTARMLLTTALTLQAGAAPAQEHGGMRGMDHGAMTMPQAEGAFSEAMDAMMRAMDAVEATGDPDADFLLMMIPHHRSAVDMARALLERSDDAEVAALARAVIDAQEAEIAAMEAMLARLGHPVE